MIYGSFEPYWALEGQDGIVVTYCGVQTSVDARDFIFSVLV